MSELLNSDYAVLHHTLGISDPRQSAPYRNHFVASGGHHDLPAIIRLCDAGLMTEGSGPSFIGDEQRVFYATEIGKAKAIESRPKPPKITRGQKNYRAYLSSETDESFIEFMKNPYWDNYRARI